MRYLTFFYLVVILLLSSCKSEEERKFPDISNLSDYPNTAFVTTMEDAMPSGKTVIYSPAFLFAWDEIRNMINAPIKSTTQNSKEFEWMNSSTTFQRSLLPHEYETNVGHHENALEASAVFYKSLPFKSQFQRLAEPMFFMSTHVEAFGMNNYDYDLEAQMQILYYKNDDNFVLKLLPKDSVNEIIIMKGAGAKQNFVQYQQELDQKIVEGATEKSKSFWKYDITSGDVVRIPIIAFNLETNYSALEGQQFSVGTKPHTIAMAYQRTALLLDESGALVDSETSLVVDSVGMELEVPTPKKLILDSPFILFIKRSNCENPYLIVKVENADLMVKPIPKKK